MSISGATGFLSCLQRAGQLVRKNAKSGTIAASKPERQAMKSPKLPSIREVASLLVSIKGDIDDDCRCTDDPDDETPGMLVTIGASPNGSWSFQTGDNSFTGGAYGHRHWGLCYLYRRSNCRELARQAIDEIAESMAYDRTDD